MFSSNTTAAVTDATTAAPPAGGAAATPVFGSGGGFFASAMPAGTLEKREAAAKSFSKEGTRKFTAIVNGIRKMESTRSTLVSQVGYEPGQGTGTSIKAPDSISMTIVDLANVPMADGDRVNEHGVREYKVEVKGDPKLTAYIAQRIDAYAAGAAGGLDPVTYAFMATFFDPTATVSANGHPALLKKSIYMALPTDPAVLVTDVKLFKPKGAVVGLTIYKIKAGDVVNVNNASFAIYVCEPKPKKKKTGAAAAEEKVSVPVPPAGTGETPVDGAAPVAPAPEAVDPPLIMYSLSASSITASDQNFAGSLSSKLASYFPPSRRSLCDIPDNVLANLHLVVSSGNWPGAGVVPPHGPAVIREEQIPTDASIYLKAPMGETLESTPAREMHGKRTLIEMPYQGADPAAELAARTTFPTVCELELWREQCIKTGITRNDDWLGIGGRFPWHYRAVLKLDMINTRACDANKGDTRALYGVAGTLKTKIVTIEFDIVRSLEDFAVQVSPAFVFSQWADKHMVAMQQGVQRDLLNLNHQHWENGLHSNRAALQIINLNEYSGEVGVIVSASRVFAICNKQWSPDQLAQLKALSNQEREAVLRQTPEAAIKLAADEAPLRWLLYAVTPAYDAANAPVVTKPGHQ